MANPWEGLRASRLKTPEEELMEQLEALSGSSPQSGIVAGRMNREPAGLPVAAPGSAPSTPLVLSPDAMAEQAAKTQQQLMVNVRRAQPSAAEAKKEGLKSDASVQTDTDLKQQTVQSLWADPLKMREVYDSVSNLPDIQAQKAGLDRYEQMLIGQMKDHEPNYFEALARPLAALADAQTGSRMAASMPEPSHDKYKTLLTLMDKAQDNRRDLNSKVLDAVRSFKSGTALDQLLQQGKLKIDASAGDFGGQGGGGKPQVNNAFEKIWDQFSKDKVAGKALTQLQFIPDAQAMLANENSISDEMLKRALLNLAHDTRPSDRDVGAFGGDRRLLNRAQQAWDWAFGSGSFTPLNRQEISAIIEGFTRVSGERFTTTAKKNAKAAVAAHPELGSEQKVLQFIYDRAGYSPADFKAKPAPKAAPGPTDQNAKISEAMKKIQELEAKKKAAGK